MSNLETIEEIRKYLEFLKTNCYGNKSFIEMLPLQKLFYSDNGKKYKWLNIIQLTGLKYNASEIGRKIGYSGSTVEKQKTEIKNAIEDLSMYKYPLPAIFESDYKITETKTTPIIREFAKKWEIYIILFLESKGLKSYISLEEHIVNYVKSVFEVYNK